MIGKGKSISHTKASISYGWNNEKDAEIVFRQNLLGESPLELTNEFKLTHQLNCSCKKNTLSFVLSPTIEDGKKLTTKDLEKITASFMKEMNLGDRQAIAFIHNDRQHKHAHLYVNRIDFSGIAYNDSYIGKRSQKAAYRVAKTHGLTTVEDIQERKLEANKDVRAEIRERHLNVLSEIKPKSFEQYIEAMQSHKVIVAPCLNKSNQIQGFRFEYNSQNFKGSEVHRSMSFEKLKLEISINCDENISQILTLQHIRRNDKNNQQSNNTKQSNKLNL